jgi:hypothetical protein
VIAMGNYPYSSSYLMHGLSMLPAWPVESACLSLEFPLATDKALMEAVRMAGAVFHNNSFDQQCFNITGTVCGFDRILHAIMPLVPTPVRLKLLHACDQ